MFDLPNYTTAECTDGPKSGGIELKEFIIRWDYDGDGKITVSLNDKEDSMIQSIEHTKSK
jgi:hypothetical protein